MDALSIAATDETPEVHLDPAAGKFLIAGKSLPEDVREFYDPMLAWLKGYRSSPNSSTAFDFKMDYFNTASSKMLLDVMLVLEELSNNGGEVLVRWHFQEDDEDIEEAGEEFGEIVDIPFEYISFE